MECAGLCLMHNLFCRDMLFGILVSERSDTKVMICRRLFLKTLILGSKMPSEKAFQTAFVL
ncbi:TPA: hypothetical protein ACFK3H_10880 [Neisseria gonorrhoeae]